MRLLLGCSPIKNHGDALPHGVDENWRTGQTSIVGRGPLLRSEYERNDQGIEEVGESGVERP